MKVIELHASRVGGCSRALAFHIMHAKEGPLPDRVKKIYAEGDRIEEEGLEELRRRGYTIKRGEQRSILLKVAGRVVKVFGNPDFKAKHEGKWLPLELKSMNRMRFQGFPKKFADWQDNLKMKYSFQLKGYLLVCNTDNIFFVGKEKTGKGKSDGRVKDILVNEADLPSAEAYKGRISRALSVLGGKEILPERYEKCEWCRYQWICDKPIIKTKKLLKIEEGDEDLMNRLKNDFLSLQASAEDLLDLFLRYQWFSSIFSNKYKLEAFKKIMNKNPLSKILEVMK